MKRGFIMTTEKNEKTLRLQSTLQEAIQPLLAKMENLEQEVASLRKEQTVIKKLLQEKDS
jgi:uncharacterized protein YlxW (UPF0749 family)